MNNFSDFNLIKPLQNAIDDLGFTKATPVQEQAYPLILSGKDTVGISQTGTGKSFAYMLPLLQQLTFSQQIQPRILVLVPTRELVIQVVSQFESLSTYMSIRVMGVYGGVNINTQKQVVSKGTDILVATPGRLYDLILCGSIQLKSIKKLVIDEVDVMLDLGFRYQLTNILDLIPEKRQSIMFSATMTQEVDTLIDDSFRITNKISIAVSGTPLHNISQVCYKVPNFHTKINLVSHIISNKEEYSKVLIFLSSKKHADRLFEALELSYGSEMCIIHSNKSQNYRKRSIQQFEEGMNRILIATDVIARGLDLSKITHVISFDTPLFPENYMHRIGRTGRAEQMGSSILFYTPLENEEKLAVEKLMNYTIPVVDIPEEVKISKILLPEEKPKSTSVNKNRKQDTVVSGAAFHEKKEKNQKTNQGGSYLRKKKKHKRPITRGDKNANRRRK